MQKLLVPLRVAFALFLFVFLSQTQGDVLCRLYRKLIDATAEPSHWLLGGAVTIILIIIMLLPMRTAFCRRYPLTETIPAAFAAVLLVSLPFAGWQHVLLTILYYIISGWLLVCCSIRLNKTYRTARRRLPLLLYGTGTLLVCFVTGLRAAATDADHYELRTAEALRRCNYAAAYRTGEISLAVTPRLFAMRSYLMATHGEGLPQMLFKQPIPAGGSKHLLLPDDDWQRLNFPPDSLYARLGGKPAANETALHFFKRHALPADTAHRPTPLARDYYLCALLLDRRLSDFANAYAALCPNDSVNIPRFYSEALALHSRKHTLPFAYSDAAVAANLLDFMDMARTAGTAQEGRNLLRRSYGETFWWYYYFGQKGTGLSDYMGN